VKLRYCTACKAAPLANRASKLRLKEAPAAALPITTKSLSCRFSPDAEKFAAPVRSNRPSISSKASRIWMIVLRGYFVLASGLVLVRIIMLVMNN
jgi:hypothetical protein